MSSLLKDICNLQKKLHDNKTKTAQLGWLKLWFAASLDISYASAAIFKANSTYIHSCTFALRVMAHFNTASSSVVQKKQS